MTAPRLRLLPGADDFATDVLPRLQEDDDAVDVRGLPLPPLPPPHPAPRPRSADRRPPIGSGALVGLLLAAALVAIVAAWPALTAVVGAW